MYLYKALIATLDSLLLQLLKCGRVCKSPNTAVRDPHGKDVVAVATEGLAVKEVAPTTDGLSDEQT